MGKQTRETEGRPTGRAADVGKQHEKDCAEKKKPRGTEDVCEERTGLLNHQ